MDFEFLFWSQKVQGSVTDCLPGMRERETQTSRSGDPGEGRRDGKYGWEVHANAASESALYMCEPKN